MKDFDIAEWKNRCIKIHCDFIYFKNFFKWYMSILSRIDMCMNYYFPCRFKDLNSGYNIRISRTSKLKKIKDKIVYSKRLSEEIYSILYNWHWMVENDFYEVIGPYNFFYKIKDCYSFYNININEFEVLKDESVIELKNDKFSNVWLELFYTEKNIIENIMTKIEKIAIDCIESFKKLNDIIEEYNLKSLSSVCSFEKYLAVKDTTINGKSIATIMEIDIYERIPKGDDIEDLIDFIESYMLIIKNQNIKLPIYID